MASENLFDFAKYYIFDAAANQNISETEGKLDSLNQSLQSNIGAYTGVAAQQQEVNSILSQYESDLSGNIDYLDTANTQQQRLINMNRSYSKRYEHFNKITYSIILSTLLIIALIYEQKLLGFIPEWINTILYVIIIAVCGIYIMFTMADVYSRQDMDFDKIKQKAPIGANGNDGDSGSNNNNENDVTPSTCQGASCCEYASVELATNAPSGSTYYDPEESKCKVK
tara:strand:+ start:1229 stop:1906 length:678 start_codon:yes stop_codon:yes gene_type:complete